METMKEYYLELGQSEHISDYFTNIDLDLPEWQSYMGWEASIIPLEAVLIEDKLADIHAKYPIEGAAVLKMDPFQAYKWHTDSGRACTVNMLLQDQRSICLFGEDRDENNVDFVELKYKPDTFYLFNTRVPHTVINFEGMRYMFSIQFKDFVDYSTLWHEFSPDAYYRPNNLSSLI